jgi:DNA polymerase-4
LFVPPRFDVYREVSAYIRSIFARYTPIIEPLALDEAYLDVTDYLAEGQTATETAAAIRAAIKAETGLTASAGVSYNKFLAKMASEQRKPDGLFVITPKMGPAFVEALPVRKFHGIGPATAGKMQKLGIESGADLKACAPEFLRRHFGKAGSFYYAIARGIDERAVRPDRERKSIGAENTYLEDLVTYDAASEKIVVLAKKVWTACERAGLRGRSITLKVKYADFQQITRSHTADTPVQSAADLERRTLTLLAPLFPTRKGVRLLGVTISAFDEAKVAAKQLNLLFSDK